jgi:hypothetical protein
VIRLELSPHASAVLFVSLVAEILAVQQSDCFQILWPKSSGEVSGSSPTSCARARKSGGNKAQPTHREELPRTGECSRRPSSMAVGTPALVGGQHVVIRLELSSHASAVLFVSLTHGHIELAYTQKLKGGGAEGGICMQGPWAPHLSFKCKLHCRGSSARLD